MAERIQVGDLVRLYKAPHPCFEGYVNYINTVSYISASSGRCNLCNRFIVKSQAAVLDDGHVWPISWLRRIPPLDELERDQIVDEATA